MSAFNAQHKALAHTLNMVIFGLEASLLTVLLPVRSSCWGWTDLGKHVRQLCQTECTITRTLSYFLFTPLNIFAQNSFNCTRNETNCTLRVRWRSSSGECTLCALSYSEVRKACGFPSAFASGLGSLFLGLCAKTTQNYTNAWATPSTYCKCICLEWILKSGLARVSTWQWWMDVVFSSRFVALGLSSCRLCVQQMSHPPNVWFSDWRCAKLLQRAIHFTCAAL